MFSKQAKNTGVANLTNFFPIGGWAGGSLTRIPKGSFSVFWPRQLGKKIVITITISRNISVSVAYTITKKQN